MPEKKIQSEKLSDQQCIQGYFEVLRRLKAGPSLIQFLKNNLTEHEIVMGFRRFQIAVLILQGVPQRDIKERLEVGFDKIFRVQDILDKDQSAYQEAVKRYLWDKKTEADKRLEKAIAVEQRALRGRTPWWYFPQGLGRG
jgi:uncharacterized protein YerC